MWNLQKCSNGQYCCRDSKSSESCCDEAESPFDFNIGKFQLNIPAPTKTINEQTSGSGSQTLAPVTGPAIVSGTSHTASSGTQSESCSGPDAVVIGGAVGGTLGAALVACLAVIVFLCRRNARSSKLESTGHALLRLLTICFIRIRNGEAGVRA